MLMNISIWMLVFAFCSFVVLIIGVLMSPNSMNKDGKSEKNFTRLFYKHTYLPSRHYVRYMITLGATGLSVSSGSFCGLVFSGVL